MMRSISRGGQAAVTVAILLIRRQLRPGAFGALRDEDRVVAEAGGAGHLRLGDAARIVAAGQLQAFAPGDGDHAAEAGAALRRRQVAQRLQQTLAPLRHAQAGAAPARGVDAGRAIQRIHEESGVVRQRWQAAGR